MVYFISNTQSLFPAFESISVQDSIALFKDDWRIQVDSETTGLTPQGKICDFLCFQIGNDQHQIVIDTSTIDIRLYKELLESKLCVLANGKFDLMFLYNYDIHPTKIYDVMIVEQVIHLGWPSGFIGLSNEQVIQYMDFITSIPNWDNLRADEKKILRQINIPELDEYISEHCGCSLKSLCYRYLGIEMDKSVRGEIIYTGLTDRVIQYAATDVVYLNKIMDAQIVKLRELHLLQYAKIETDFVPVCAYGEWCGVYLNPRRWSIKMYHNNKHYKQALKELDDWFLAEAERNPRLKEPVNIGKSKKKVRLFTQNLQLSLFEDVDTSVHRSFDWSQGDYVIAVAKILGFDVSVIDKKKGIEKDSVEEDVLKGQKGINDKFLELYLAYKGWDKEISGYGQNYLDAINPITGRLHPVWRQIGTISARMTNSSETQKDLMRIKKLGREIKSVNVQVLPKSFMCRESFTSQNQYADLLISCDFSAIEARLGAMIYNDEMMLNTFIKGWDSHSVAAKLCFPEELKDIDIKDIKKLRPDLRQKAKAPEFKWTPYIEIYM